MTDTVATTDPYAPRSDRMPTKASLLGALVVGIGGGLTLAWAGFLGWALLWMLGAV